MAENFSDFTKDTNPQISKSKETSKRIKGKKSESRFSSVQFSSVAQLCPTLCDPMNHSTPGLPVHHQLPLSCVQLFANPWTIQSMEFSRPEYCSGQLFPSLGDLSNPSIKSGFPALQENSLPAELPGKPSKRIKFPHKKIHIKTHCN